MVLPNTELGQKVKEGGFDLPTQRELLLELREMVADTCLTRGIFLSNHASNYLPLKVKMPAGKDQALLAIDAAIQGAVPLKPEWMRAL